MRSSTRACRAACSSSAQSVSRDQNHVFHVPLWDIVAQRSSTGGYPWKVEGDASTVVYLKNVTERAQHYVLQLRHDAGVYSPGLKTVAPHQPVALDLRSLRDRRVPDERGLTIPPDAAGGQVHWSIRGAENQVMIGRAEQADEAGGLATSYACQNCCPDSFYDALATDCTDPLFPSETSRLRAYQSDRTCYGAILDPYSIDFASWQSFNAGVATVDGPSGLAEGQGAGSATMRASWPAAAWYYRPATASCASFLLSETAESLCDVLNQDVIFNTARFANISAPFNSNTVPSATLNLGEGTGGSTVCAGPGPSARFTTVLDFKMPVGANVIHPRGDPRTSVSIGDDHQFAFQDYGFRNINFATRDAQMWIDLVRARPTAPRNHILVTISGEYGNQTGAWSGRARVNLVCP